MRELGRFTLAEKDMDLQDVCDPSKFQLVVDVAKRLTQFSPGKKEHGKPSTAVQIGFCLKGAVEVLIGQTLMNDDDLAEKKEKNSWNFWIKTGKTMFPSVLTKPYKKRDGTDEMTSPSPKR